MASSASDKNGPKPRVRRTALERLRLARLIDEARLKGLEWDEVSTRVGVPTRTAQDIHRKFVIQMDALRDPRQALIETAFLSTAAIDVLCDEMENGDSSSARVGAARALVKAQHERLNLLSNIGWVPANVGARMRYADSRRFTEQILDVLQRNELPEHVWHEIERLLEEVPEDGIEDVAPPSAINRPKEKPW